MTFQATNFIHVAWYAAEFAGLTMAGCCRSIRQHTVFSLQNRKKTGKQLPEWLSMKR